MEAMAGTESIMYWYEVLVRNKSSTSTSAGKVQGANGQNVLIRSRLSSYCHSPSTASKVIHTIVQWVTSQHPVV
jgi:hypothetical protein